MPGRRRRFIPVHAGRRSRVWVLRVGRSFGHAFRGMAYLFLNERNARIELAAGVAACLLAAWLGIGRVEWALLVLTIALVLSLEGINTAIESALDVSCPDAHPLARIAKDVSAAAVTIAAIAALVVGLLVLGPPLWDKVAG